MALSKPELFLMVHTRFQEAHIQYVQEAKEMLLSFVPLFPPTSLFKRSTKTGGGYKQMAMKTIFTIGKDCVLCSAQWKEYRMEVVYNTRG